MMAPSFNVALLTLLPLLLLCGGAASPPAFLPATSPSFQYTGRVAFNGSSALLEWSSSRATLHLNCTGASTTDAPPPYLTYHLAAPTGLAMIPFAALETYVLLVDGEEHGRFEVSAKLGTAYRVAVPASSMDGAVHSYAIVKNTERMTIPLDWSLSEGQNATAFAGVTLPAVSGDGDAEGAGEVAGGADGVSVTSSCAVHPPAARPPRRLEFFGDSIT